MTPMIPLRQSWSKRRTIYRLRIEGETVGFIAPMACGYRAKGISPQYGEVQIGIAATRPEAVRMVERWVEKNL